MIHIKTVDEIKKMQNAGRIVAMVYGALKGFIQPGITTLDIDRLAEEIIRKEGAIPSFLNYGSPPFPRSVCTSVNDEIVHGIPSADRILVDGDIVSVDIGAKLNGYHGDGARTFAVGNISPDAQRLIDVTKECFWKAFPFAREGCRLGDISSAVQTHAEENGYSVVRELVGHGIGRDLHEEPNVPNFKEKGQGVRLVNGMVLAVEPMINMGTRKIAYSKDQWTIVTADGNLSAHYENTIAITADGPLITTTLDL